MTTETQTFGEHLMIDGYGGNYDLLMNREIVLSCLADLPGLLGMGILGGPEIYWCEGNDTKDPGGWTGVVAILESHISVHTFPGTGFVSIDVYTCKNGMDLEFIKDFFTKKFDLKDLEVNFVKRGTRYPLLVSTKAEENA